MKKNMSKDIRSYFTKSPKGPAETIRTNKKSSLVLLSSDEDDLKPSKAKSSSSKPGKKSSRRGVLSDSSDDDSPPAPSKGKKKPAEEAKKKESLKAVAPSDLFGNKPAVRVKSTAISKKLQQKESEFHEDDDFEATLCQLDTSEIESEYLQSASKEVATNSKRKNRDESDDDVKKKKIRRDDRSSDAKVSDDENYREKESQRNSSSSDIMEIPKTPEANTEKKKRPEGIAIAKTNHKKEEESAKTSSSSDKLKFGNLKKTKNKTEIVFEKHETKKSKEKIADESVDVYEEIIEKKKQRAVLYNKYLQRGGARNPGSKPIPQGADNCLAGLVFLITGVLDSLEREDAEELIQKYGGRTVKSLSKKTNYMVVGEDAGASKLDKAESFGTKQISEDELLDLIKTRPAGKSKDIVQAKNNSKNRKRSRTPESFIKSPSPKKVPPPAKVTLPSTEKIVSPSSSQTQDSGIGSSASIPEDFPTTSTDRKVFGKPVEALVEKYRPKTMKQIVGQQGDKSQAKKLHTWLSNWQKNQNGSVKLTRPGIYAKNDDGAFYKACLLSGPPGVGKTTTAQVVCAELQLDLLEFNASDTRSKRLLKEEVSEILSNTTIKGYFGKRFNRKLSSKHVLLMDEVDGMAGNEDRGGLQELISLIKSSDVPIICICNDRHNQKIRTLSNYTFDLRFPKPRLEQIRGAMKSMCCKEQINVSTEHIDRLIQSTNQDIRQVINHLAILGAGSTNHEKSTSLRSDKDLRLGPWDVIRKVFSAEEHEKMSIHDKSDLFFHDYNLAALFVQENYLSVTPKAPSTELLDRIAQSAESLAMGDLIENSIRRNNAWTLLPTQACFSSVIPGSLMSGRLTAQANFPSWLGRNSKRGKFDRLMQEITTHSRLTTGASKEAMNLDYLNHLRDGIVRPLVLRQNDGIEESLNVMNKYHLLREDLESLVEVSLWPGQRDPMQAIDSKVKAAFTRAYNKSSAPAPYLINAAPKKKTNEASQDEGFLEGEDADVASDDNNDEMETDRMIKAKKAVASNKTASTSKTVPKPTKRGRGRGKAK